MDWPAVGRARRAGVSSFGVSGTNAHVVIEQAPAAEPATPQPESVITTLVVSGKTPARIASTAATLADWMIGAGAAVPLADVAHTLNHHRTQHKSFATLVVRDRAHAVAGLQALAAGQSAIGLVGPHEGLCKPGTVFVYSGQGSQWAGMGRQLLVDEPAFAAAVEELEPLFLEHMRFSLHQVLTEGQRVAGDARVQPVLMGLQLALTALWRSYGVEPDAVIGHSMGEVTAAVVSGALTPDEGLRVIGTRSRLMSRLAGQGAVGLLEMDAEAAEKLLADYPEVSLAGFLSPRQTVIAGPVAQVDAAIVAVSEQERFARRVNMEVASHTALMDPILPELRSALADLTPKAPTIPFISTVADPAVAPTLDADYWVANVREPVRLHQAITAAAAQHATFVEISPHPTLTHAITETLESVHHHSVGTLSRKGDDTVSFHTNLNSTHVMRPPTLPHPPEPHPVLPSAPWHHTRHWISAEEFVKTAESAPQRGTLLGQHIPVAATPPTHLWQARLTSATKPYPGSHHNNGVEIIPISVLLQTLSTAAGEYDAVRHPLRVPDRRRRAAGHPGGRRRRFCHGLVERRGRIPTAPPALDPARQRPHLRRRRASAGLSEAVRRPGFDRRRVHRRVGDVVLADLGQRGPSLRLVDRLVPVQGRRTARRRRADPGLGSCVAGRRNSHRPAAGQRQPAADGSGRGRRRPVRRRTRRPARPRRSAPSRRRRRGTRRRHHADRAGRQHLHRGARTALRRGGLQRRRRPQRRSRLDGARHRLAAVHSRRGPRGSGRRPEHRCGVGRQRHCRRAARRPEPERLLVGRRRRRAIRPLCRRIPFR